MNYFTKLYALRFFCMSLLGCLFYYPLHAQSDISPFIHVDQFGYYPTNSKVAVLSDPQTGFNSNQSYTPSGTIELRRTDNDAVVFSQAPAVWNGGATHDYSGDRGWWFDFSSYQTEGSYYVFDPVNDQRSADFVISCNPYKDVLVAATRMFYYNRCNFEKTTPYADSKWTDGMNFMNNRQDGNARYAYDQNNAATERDLSGGWFDAGDYNKYITFAFHAVDQLLWAYRHNPEIFTDDTNIPESGNGISDIIDELKWELDWMKKMMNADGSVIIKMGNTVYGPNDQSPPSINVEPRYYGHTCTSASISMAANFANAAKVFSDIPAFATFAQDLQQRAMTCFNYVLPYINNNTLETNCDDQTVKSGDADWNEERQLEVALIAAIHLFDLTGDPLYGNYIINNVNSVEPMSTLYWGDSKVPLHEALLYYTTLSNADPTTAAAIINSFHTASTNNWNGYYGMNEADLYRAFMPEWSYHWGSNQAANNFANINTLVIDYQIENTLNATMKDKAFGMLHYIHGVNPFGMVYLTNMYEYGAERSSNEIYHSWFANQSIYDNVLTSLYGPAPGYVPGGPNFHFTLTNLSPPSGQPRQKSYLEFNDNNNSWEITEPAIYYQAAYIRNLSRLMAMENSNCVSNCDNAGATCDDGNACTTGDVYDSNCNCAGTFQDADNDSVCDANDVCPNFNDSLIGTSCDDGDPNTENDTWGNDCTCTGTPVVGGCTITTISSGGQVQSSNGSQNCRTFDLGGEYQDISFTLSNVNTKINGKPATRYSDLVTVQYLSGGNTQIHATYTSDATVDISGSITAIIVCIEDNDGQLGASVKADVGTVTSCIDDGTPPDCTPGSACNDNDICTTGDVYDANCNCAGTFQDSDNDGVCNANDVCPNFDDNLIGTTCDDGDPNTINDTWGSDCNCTGTPGGGGGCNTYNNESFETDWGIWNDGGGDVSSDAVYANTGTYSVRLRDNSGQQSSIYTDVLDLSAYSSLDISFSFFASSMETGEDFMLEMSTDGGSSYSVIKSWVSGTDFTNGTRYNETVTVSGMSSSTVFRIRCDASANNDRVYIDDVVIEDCSGENKLEDEIGTVNIFPNPSHNHINVDLSQIIQTLDSDNIEVNIFSLDGKRVYQNEIQIVDILHLNIEALSSAQMYLLHLHTDDGRMFRGKFVKF